MLLTNTPVCDSLTMAKYGFAIWDPGLILMGSMEEIETPLPFLAVC